MTEELKKIKLFLDRIKVLKQQGLTRFGIVASYLHHQVQPLKVREHYGFECRRSLSDGPYSGADKGGGLGVPPQDFEGFECPSA
jgi:hypothetical protein